MKIDVYFKKYKLGEMAKQNNEIVYNSFKESEKLFQETCFSTIFYNLFGSENKKIETPPNFLKDYYEMSENEFYINKVNILSADDTFTKLYKLSTLNLDDFGFYIKAN